MGQEMAKWEVKRPFAPFPRMMYMAQRRPDGVYSVGETEDRLAGGNVESFNARCQMVVNSEQEMSAALERGWRPTPREAMERHEAKETAISTAAAHRAYEDRNLSDAARAEAAAYEASTPEHVAEIPVQRRGPGRPRKDATV
jgi:hypothetical protein